MHHCAGACCCPSRRDAIQKGSSLAHKVLFRAAPSTPAANKWSKLGPVLDWVLLNMLCHSILLNLMLSLQVRPAAKEGQDDDDVDESLRQELNFAALKGKRWQACTDFFHDSGARHHHDLLGLDAGAIEKFDCLVDEERAGGGQPAEGANA